MPKGVRMMVPHSYPTWWHRAGVRRLGFAAAIVALTTFLLPIRAHAAPTINLPDPFASAAQDVIDTVTKWVADGATWVLQQVVSIVQQNTAIDLNGQWFMKHYATMIALGSFVVVPMLLLAAAKSALAGDATIALRAAFVFLPLAMLGTFIAIHVVNMLLQIVDWMSAAMTSSLNSDYQGFATGVGNALNGGNGNSIATPFILFFCAFFMVIFGLLVFIELLFRNAAVIAMAVFIPLAFAALVFPSTGVIAKRLFEGLVGLILYKFFIVAVLAVGVSALGATSSDQGGGFGTVLAGVVILILAAVLPNLLISYLPLLEGAAIAAVASRTAMNRAQSAVGAGSSDSVYSGIRRTNEARLGSAGGGAGAGTVALVGARGASQNQHIHLPGSRPGGSGAGGASGRSSGGAAGGGPVAGGSGGAPGPSGRPGRGGGSGGRGLGGGGTPAQGPPGPPGPQGPPGPPGNAGADKPAEAAGSGGGISGLSARRTGGSLPLSGRRPPAGPGSRG